MSNPWIVALGVVLGGIAGTAWHVGLESLVVAALVSGAVLAYYDLASLRSGRGDWGDRDSRGRA